MVKPLCSPRGKRPATPEQLGKQYAAEKQPKQKKEEELSIRRGGQLRISRAAQLDCLLKRRFLALSIEKMPSSYNMSMEHILQGNGVSHANVQVCGCLGWNLYDRNVRLGAA